MTDTAPEAHEDDFDDAPAPVDDRFRIDSESKMNWFVGKLNGYDEADARIDAQYAAMKRDIANRRDGLKRRFMAEAEGWADANRPSKGKSIKLLAGTVGWRENKGGPRIVDKAALMDWANENAPGLLVTESITKPDTSAVYAHFATTGEIPPGVEYVEPGDRFYVKGALFK